MLLGNDLSREFLYTIISLGCPKNRVDTEKMMFVMSNGGYSFTESPPDADVIIINTCAFIELATEESINTILDYMEENPDAIMVVAGCLPMRYKAEAAESLPEVDIFIEPDNMADLPALVDEAMRASGKTKSVSVKGLKQSAIGRLITTPGYAYLRVSDGCDRKCAYCSIPSIRGRMKSEPPEKLEKEALELASRGANELILVAQDLCSYGIDLKIRNGLELLLERLNRMDAVSWIRLMYLHPNGFPKGLPDLIRNSEKILPYLDIPIQHISARILKDMKRPWNSDAIKKLFDSVRERVPGIVLRTTVMVGYPTETDADFRELSNFIESYQIERVGVFTYSAEEGSSAFALGDPVSTEVKQARADEIVEIHSRFLEKRNSSRIGAIEPAIVEGYSEETELLLQGRLWDQAPEVDGALFITDGNAVAGGIYDVRINECVGTDLFGEIVV